jgi:hypothetical protein
VQAAGAWPAALVVEVPCWGRAAGGGGEWAGRGFRLARAGWTCTGRLDGRCQSHEGLVHPRGSARVHRPAHSPLPGCVPPPAGTDTPAREGSSTPAAAGPRDSSRDWQGDRNSGDCDEAARPYAVAQVLCVPLPSDPGFSTTVYECSSPEEVVTCYRAAKRVRHRGLGALREISGTIKQLSPEKIKEGAITVTDLPEDKLSRRRAKQIN